ncbi:MAG: enolase C-terminal domain-like protein [Nocardioidaceae bacterium]
MRITDVTLTPILIEDCPLLNVGGVHQPYAPRLVVEVHAEDGTTGVGETYGDTTYLEIAEQVAAEIVGRQLWETNLLTHSAATVGGRQHADTMAELNSGGFRGRVTAGKQRASVTSAFEVACLDALGKSLGLPVHALLGGKVRDRVDYSAYLFYKWSAHPDPDAPEDGWGEVVDPDGVVRLAHTFLDRYGFKSIKLKGGAFPPQEEVAAIAALHEEFPDHPLRLDPNGAWSVDTAVKVAEDTREMLEYLEDPTLDTSGMSEVRRRTGVTLATNMCVTTFDEIPEAFAGDAVQVVLSDHHYWGGLDATAKLAAVCRPWSVAVSMHSNTHLGVSLAAMTHVAATIPELHYACDTHRPWQYEDIITEPHRFTDGALEVDDRPGLGIELDRDAMARLHERWTGSDVRERDDVAAMKRARPGWEPSGFPKW